MFEVIIILFTISILVLIAVALFQLFDRRWEKKTAMERENRLARRDRIITYLEKVDAQVERSNRSDAAEICKMLFKLKNRWKIIYKYHRPFRYKGYIPPHPKVIAAAAERDNLETKLMDKGIDLEYPD